MKLGLLLLFAAAALLSALIALGRAEPPALAAHPQAPALTVSANEALEPSWPRYAVAVLIGALPALALLQTAGRTRRLAIAITTGLHLAACVVVASGASLSSSGGFIGPASAVLLLPSAALGLTSAFLVRQPKEPSVEFHD